MVADHATHGGGSGAVPLGANFYRRNTRRRGLRTGGRRAARAQGPAHVTSVSKIHAATAIPKPTIVRMLETLIADGYVVRDNMCGSYRVTARTRELPCRA